ncbi:MAG: LysR family transcriptional regulator [Hyphomicrobiaceae bacterium]|nr:LysR family transcriptional regulator [Hyphomicrobiaceae bacterium]
MDRLESMSAFVAVVEAGGFSAAARKLHIPLATVSRRVSELEVHLGIQLLIRTTRSVALTETGQRYFDTTCRLLDEIGEAERLASGEYTAPRGELRIAAPVGLGRMYLAPIITEFLRAYPEVDVALQLSDEVINLADEGIDIALRVGELPDSSLKAIRLGEIRRVVCASAAYLKRARDLASPEDLRHHTCITFTALESAHEWAFHIGKTVKRVAVRSRLSVSAADAAADAAAAGLGITRLLCYQAHPAISAKKLKLILRDYEPPPRPVNFIYRAGRSTPQKLKAFVDFASPRMKSRLVFDP